MERYYDYMGWYPHEYAWGIPCQCGGQVSAYPPSPGDGFPFPPWMVPAAYAPYPPMPPANGTQVQHRKDRGKKTMKIAHHQGNTKRDDGSESPWIRAYQRKKREEN